MHTWLERKKKTPRAKISNKGDASLQILDGNILQLSESITTCRFNVAVQRRLLQVRIDVSVPAGRTNLQKRGKRDGQ